jgi:hypothetical protein
VPRADPTSMRPVVSSPVGFEQPTAAVGDVAPRVDDPELRSGGATGAVGVSRTTGCRSPAPLRLWSARRHSGSTGQRPGPTERVARALSLLPRAPRSVGTGHLR